MKIRLEGTLPELQAAEAALRLSFAVTNVSKPYRNRDAALYRVYIEAEPTQAPEGK